MILLDVEWDARKAASNKRKHGVTFEEAATALRDLFSKTGDDPDHSISEERLITFGMSCQRRLLVVSHVERENAIRIISARLANGSERKIYEDG